jgi:DNA-binding MarR family transcriptional regulator
MAQRTARLKLKSTLLDPTGKVRPEGSELLLNFLGTHIRLAHFVAISTLEPLFARLGTTPTRFALLVHTKELPGTNQTRLADLLGADRTTLVPVLLSMEEQGLIRRTRAEHDKRTTKIWITPKGQALLTQLIPLATAHDQRLRQRLSARDQQALVKILAKIRRNLAGKDR